MAATQVRFENSSYPRRANLDALPAESGWNLVKISDRLCEELRALRFAAPVSYVYNPAVYARAPFVRYATRLGNRPKDVLLLGMNPGPWGMSQTGVPFGSVSIVREWMGIHEKVNRPEREHPKRRILGFDCRREEVSGQRLWGWARDNFREPSRFFERFFVANYCPLAFLESSGRNRTPNQLPAGERKLLFERCDPALREIVDFLAVRVVIGVGRFAEERAQSALAGLGLRIEGIPHPSPANPAAGRNWGEKVSEKLNSWGIELGRISTHVRR